MAAEPIRSAPRWERCVAIVLALAALAGCETPNHGWTNVPACVDDMGTAFEPLVVVVVHDNGFTIGSVELIPAARATKVKVAVVHCEGDKGTFRAMPDQVAQLRKDMKAGITPSICAKQKDVVKPVDVGTKQVGGKAMLVFPSIPAEHLSCRKGAPTLIDVTQ